MAPLIELRNVYKYFGGLCAINNVSLRVARGEVIGLVGDNAAGKSTLMGPELGKGPEWEGPQAAKTLPIEPFLGVETLLVYYGSGDSIWRNRTCVKTGRNKN